jgi:ribonuclease HII
MYTVGIDEVGRGPLAGPVVVSVLAIPENIKIPGRSKLKDSKKLTAREREVWFEYVKNNPLIFYATARVYPRKIEKINISNAANLAATNAFVVLLKKHRRLIKNAKTVLDGGLYLKKSVLKKHGYVLNPLTVIKGDEKFDAVKLASIVAKVTRDRYMGKLHDKYSQYDFISNKGYGTEKHFKAIRHYGPSEVHRLTFLKKVIRI